MRGMKELRLVEWRLGGIECVGPPRVGVIWEEMGTAANGRETTRQGIWAGAAHCSCDLHNRQLLSSSKDKTTNKSNKAHRNIQRKIRKFHITLKNTLKGTGTRKQQKKDKLKTSKGQGYKDNCSVLQYQIL